MIKNTLKPDFKKTAIILNPDFTVEFYYKKKMLQIQAFA
jgi:hypothetical protein